MHRLQLKKLYIFCGFALLLGGGVFFSSFFLLNVKNLHLNTSLDHTTLNGKIFSGVVYSLYEDYWPQQIQFYWRGKIVGTEYLWYPKGKIMAIRPYHNSLPHGQWKMWYEDGRVKSLRTYVDGVIDGELWGWHENGQVSDFGFYKLGKEVTYKSWISDGTPFYNYVHLNSSRIGMFGGEYCKRLVDIQR